MEVVFNLRSETPVKIWCIHDNANNHVGSLIGGVDGSYQVKCDMEAHDWGLKTVYSLDDEDAMTQVRKLFEPLAEDAGEKDSERVKIDTSDIRDHTNHTLSGLANLNKSADTMAAYLTLLAEHVGIVIARTGKDDGESRDVLVQLFTKRIISAMNTAIEAEKPSIFGNVLGELLKSITEKAGGSSIKVEVLSEEDLKARFGAEAGEEQSAPIVNTPSSSTKH